jgi:predicted DsbA family dithiol-disulfide isomerase
VKSDECLAKVNHQVAEARAKGVTGVPFTIIDGKWAVSGGQTAPVFVKVRYDPKILIQSADPA